MSKRKNKNGRSTAQKRLKGSEFEPDTVRTCWEGYRGHIGSMHNLIVIPILDLETVFVFGNKWYQMVPNGTKRYQTIGFALFADIYTHDWCLFSHAFD